MSFSQAKSLILEEIGTVLDQVNEAQVEESVNALLGGKKVFVIGVGRVMLMAQAFAKRLIHFGIDSHVVGETTVPPIGPGDVLVACSSSGETMTTVSIARLAAKHGAKVIAVTSRPDSTLADRAAVFVTLPCRTKLNQPGEPPSGQPMGSLFEQSLLIFFDSIAIDLKTRLGLTEEQLWAAHANLE